QYVIAEHGAVGESAGGAEHGQREYCRDKNETAAPARALIPAVFVAVGMIVGVMLFIFVVFVRIVAVVLVRCTVVRVCRLLVRDLVSLACLTIGGIARRLDGEIGLLPKTRGVRRRGGIDASHWLVALVPAFAVVRIDVSFVLFNLGRRISVLGWFSQDLVGR